MLSKLSNHEVAKARKLREDKDSPHKKN